MPFAITQAHPERHVSIRTISPTFRSVARAVSKRENRKFRRPRPVKCIGKPKYVVGSQYLQREQGVICGLSKGNIETGPAAPCPIADRR
jgi:hypothetical protein